MPICSCCGYNRSSGVKVPNANMKAIFVCGRCFSHPDLFFNAKRILGHWVKPEWYKTRGFRKMMRMSRDLKFKPLDFFQRQKKKRRKKGLEVFL